MATSTMLDLIRDRFKAGVWFDDTDTVVLDGDPEVKRPRYPIGHTAEGDPIYDAVGQRIEDHGHWTIVCPRCMEPAWAITRHCVEKHGDTDVEVRPTLPGKQRPDWFRDEWI